MKRYLLFDSACATCTDIAKDVSEVSLGKISHRSLRDPRVSLMLDEISSEWQWEPMLLITDDFGKPQKLIRGIMLKMEFVRVLGLKSAITLYKKIRPQLIDTAKSDVDVYGRRQLLKQAGGVAVGAITLSAIPKSLKADENSFQTFLPFTSNPTGEATSNTGSGFQPLSAAEVEHYVNKAKADDATHSFQEKLSREFPSLTLQQNKHQVYVIDDQVVIVNFEVDSPAGYSLFELRYNKETDELIETHSLLAEYDTNKNINARTYVNGKVQTNVTVSESGDLLGGVVASANGTITKVNELSAAAIPPVCCPCLTDCLAAFGVPIWVITMVGAICAIWCACSAGVGCLVCLVGVVYVMYVIAFMCVMHCWGHTN